MGIVNKDRQHFEQQDFNMSKLLSLSHDLLQSIMEFMTETELYTMACVCALLNDLSLRVFFSQRGIEVLGSKLNIIFLSLPNDQQFLSVLHIAFFIDFIQDFECELLHTSPKGIEFRRDSERVLELILPEKGTDTAPFDVGKVDLYVEHTYVRIDPDNTCDRLFSSSCIQIDLKYGTGEYTRYERNISQREIGKMPFQPSILHIIDREAFADFPKILSTMQTLHTLSIETDTMLWETRQLLPHMMPQQSFPSLTRLATTPAYAVTLRSASLPNLKSFTIIVPNVALMFTYISQQEFKAATPLLLAVEHPELRPVVIADFSDADAKGEDVRIMSRCMEEYHLNGLGLGTPLDNISVLRVIGLKSIVTREDAASFHVVLSQWVQLFRGLHQVEFYDNAEDLGEVELPVVYPLIYSIYTRCPNIVMLIIDDVEYGVTKTVHNHRTGNDSVGYKGSTLGDLNEDVFFLIFEYLSSSDLYSLSTLCRSLREWALPVYLRQRGIKDPSDSLELELKQDFDEDIMTDISALTLSSIRRTAKLTLRVTPDLNVSQIWECFSRFNRLVQKLSWIGTATLELGDDVPTIPKGFISGHTKVVWTQLMLSIFNALGEKSDTLIVHGNGVLGSLTFSIADGSPVPSRLIRLRLPEFPLEHRLSSLKINERVVMMPLFNSWVTKAFRGSKNIKNLEFLDISNYGGSCLPDLGDIFPSVEQLRIYSRAVLPSGIMASVNQLLGIKEITLVGSGQLRRNKIDIPAALTGSIPPLPLVQHLTTLPQYLSFLMEGTSLKDLQYLTIVLPHVTNKSKFSLSAMLSLAPHAEILRMWPMLKLNLQVYIGNLTQLQPAEIVADGWVEIARIMTGVILQQSPPPQSEGDRVPPDAIQGIENLRQWLALFPSLETLEFRDVTDKMMMDDVLQRLEDVKACPRLKTFLVNGNKRFDAVKKTEDPLCINVPAATV